MTMPEELTRDVPAAVRPAVEAWWRSLDALARDAVVSEARPDDTAWLTDDEGHPVVELRGRFVDPEDAIDDALWRQELIEYIDAHPEIVFFLEERRFHICRAHAVGRRVAKTGVVPRDFVCPLADRACPLQRASELGVGRAIALEARLSSFRT